MNAYEIFQAIKQDKAKKPSYGHLKLTVDEDREFLQEITLLNAIADKVSDDFCFCCEYTLQKLSIVLHVRKESIH